MADEEKQSLLSGEQKKPINEGSYGSVTGETKESEDGVGETYYRNSLGNFFYKNREKIPGYGMLRMLRQSGIYPLYVLLAMLVVYLLNQLDRYTLPIVTTSVGADLRYGDKTCQDNPHVNSTAFKDANFTGDCTKNFT